MPLHHGLRAAAGASPADPYFSSTSLLLLGNGANGGQNNTFVDGSTNNFTITRNGNTTQGSFSPFSAPDGRWSNYFDGGGDYLSVASASAIDISTGDWTIEAWCYATAKTNAVDSVCGYGSYGAMMIYYSGTNWVLEIGNGSSVVVTISGAATTNTWQHLAATRNGNTFTLWINGTSAGTGTSSATLAGSSRTLYIGYNGNSTQHFTGNISNFRLLKGTAQYSSAFTPSTSPLTAITNTSLLTCQTNRFKDNSSNAFTITPSGNAAVTSFSPFAPLAEYSAGSNGGSGYFDGINYLTFPIITFNGDFCAECWYYRTANPAAYSVLFGGPSVGVPGNHQFVVGNDGSVYMVLAQTAAIGASGTAATLNAWNHIAWVRSGSNCAIFVNGVRQGTGVSTNNASTCDRISDISNLGGYRPIGYVSNSRIVIGSSVYNPTASTLIVPTSPLTAITNTSLLLNFTNASIIDSTAKNDLETVGDAQVSTSVKKFGTGSLKFDGTGDYLSIPSSSNLAFGTGDFTIEFWAYLNSQGTFIIYDPRTAGVQAVPTIYTYLGQIKYFVDGGDRISGSTLSATTWYHIAVSRSGSSTKLFVNGTQSGSTYTDSNNYIQTPVIIGVFPINLTSYFNGYLDDLRITKGVARYTAAFTPPSAQLPSR